ncbi:MAG TPA: aminotransferase class IV [Longimicrobiales bacterium]|nr:aminotransferase class IV [Longimicrobiales bacterium]
MTAGTSGFGSGRPPIGVTLVNGREVDPTMPAVRPDDRGLTLGDGLFETLRAYGGVPFRLREHLDRLANAARRVALPLPGDLEEQVRRAIARFVEQAIGSVDARDAGTGIVPDASIRITVSRGPGPPGLEPPAELRPSAVISVREYRADERIYREGISLIVASGRRNEFAATAGLKSLGYLESVVALAEARSRNADDAVYLDTSGHLAEATTSNIFFVVDDEVLTPPTSCGILAGVTRAAVIGVARAAGLPVREEVLFPEVLDRAGEVFLTASNREIVPVRALDGRTIGSGRPGPITLDLLHRYRAIVRSETTRG